MPQILNDSDHSYFSVEADPGLREHYSLRMLEENRIDGLLRLSVCDDDGKLFLNYDITRMEPLRDWAERHRLRSEDLRLLILTLKHVSAGLAPFLLDPAGIILEAESVYTDPVSHAPCFLYCPGRNGGFGEQLSAFLHTLMELSDHDDCRSEMLAYRMYRESQAHPNALDHLERLLISGEPLDFREMPSGEILNGAAADAGSFHGIPDSGDSFHGIPGSASFRDIPGASYRSVPAGASGNAASIVAETLPADAEVVPAEPLPVRDAKGGGLFGRLRKR